MNVVLLHYHLNPGGVTTVIRQQIQLLQKSCRLLVVAGTPPPRDFPAEVFVVPEIAYGPRSTADDVADRAVRGIRRGIEKKLGGICDIVHVHNPLLAKNKYFLDVLKKLQDSDLRLFLQIHDFAEDGRPDVYFKSPYPENCHYGVINSRDYRFLINAGLEAKGLHLLPNMVTPIHPSPTKSKNRNLVLYPIRAIRRKNIGEAILLSCFFPPGATLGITLPPNSDIDFQSYRDWKQFVKRNRLPVIFGIGETENFSSLVESADFIITTSIREGFGFSFLEPWTAGKAVFGRRLSGVCTDFERAGVDLTHLYRKLRVPLSWFDSDAFFRKRRRVYENMCQWYGVPVENNEMADNLNALRSEGWMDFGFLDEIFQRQVISKLTERPARFLEFSRKNDFVERLGKLPNQAETIKTNQAAVQNAYCSLSACRQQLLKTYEGVIRNPVRQQIRKDVLIRHCLSPHCFHMLQWWTYGE